MSAHENFAMSKKSSPSPPLQGLGAVLPYRSHDVGSTNFDESSGALLYWTPNRKSSTKDVQKTPGNPWKHQVMSPKLLVCFLPISGRWYLCLWMDFTVVSSTAGCVGEPHSLDFRMIGFSFVDMCTRSAGNLPSYSSSLDRAGPDKYSLQDEVKAETVRLLG
jgi:hypothetical protein